MAFENPIYDTSIGGTKVKSRTAAEAEYRVYKVIKTGFNLLGMLVGALVRIGGDMIKEIKRPGSSSRI